MRGGGWGVVKGWKKEERFTDRRTYKNPVPIHRVEDSSESMCTNTLTAGDLSTSQIKRDSMHFQGLVSVEKTLWLGRVLCFGLSLLQSLSDWFTRSTERVVTSLVNCLGIVLVSRNLGEKPWGNWRSVLSGLTSLEIYFLSLTLLILFFFLNLLYFIRPSSVLIVIIYSLLFDYVYTFCSSQHNVILCKSLVFSREPLTFTLSFLLLSYLSNLLFQLFQRTIYFVFVDLISFTKFLIS